MNDNYFSYWVARYGRNALIHLLNKVCGNVIIPEKIKEKKKKEEYLQQYFYMVYYIVTLNHFGLSTKQIYFVLDFIMPGVYQLFSPKKILEENKDIVQDILYYIENDLKLYKDE